MKVVLITPLFREWATVTLNCKGFCHELPVVPENEIFPVSCIGVIPSLKLETWTLSYNRGISSQHTASDQILPWKLSLKSGPGLTFYALSSSLVWRPSHYTIVIPPDRCSYLLSMSLCSATATSLLPCFS